MHKAIAVFEVEGGSDKGPDGHRPDTLAIVEAIGKYGWSAEVFFFDFSDSAELTDFISSNYDGYISRIDPGTLPGGENAYLDFLNELIKRGVLGLPTPTEMLTFGTKDALVKLRDSPLVPADTYAYYDAETFDREFPISLSNGERVLKQNRGSTGTGIWRVRLADKSAAASAPAGSPIPLDTLVTCTEAVDNLTYIRPLGEFMRFCYQYLEGDTGMLVDMRFLPRISEGEIRILCVNESPIYIVHRQPAEGGESFSATLGSGATHVYETPEEWPELSEMFNKAKHLIATRLGTNSIVPFLWTADFMLETAKDGSDNYVLGEINCTCVGFSAGIGHGIEDKVAKEAIRRISESTRPIQKHRSPQAEKDCTRPVKR